ncbi:hypothetical protein E1B28_012973 [Marasmius oreades]|uniref:Uncharacterized protein n=1 Tax=Marasmius oreades TaxID=181124 RepID=A0A9P7RPL4_9AGAR|nr:uncharacterized protein E1B28_012973 [Marasmius oreades]KAG7086995.1 hypothetical protein E1B28_012973 [Marasmius oreades]
MKFFNSTLIAVAVATAVAAQRANIGFPTNGTDVIAGKDLLIEVDRPNFLSSAVEVAIVLGLTSCASYPCGAPSERGVGRILYSGPFNPQYKLDYPRLPPHQNFTVSIPGDLAKGMAQISLTQFDLVGASLIPSTSYDTIYVNVV